MINTKVLQASQSLDKKEFIRFGQFISSPFFNTNALLIKLYDYIGNYYPQFKNPDLCKEKVFEYIYPGSPYNDGTMRNLISDLYNLLERFLVEINIENDIPVSRNRLLYELHIRKLDKLFLNTLGKYESYLSGGDNINMSFFDNLRNLEISKIEYSLLRGLQKNVCRNVLNRSVYNVYTFLLWLIFDLQDLEINEDAFNAKYKYNPAKQIFSSLDLFELLKTVKKINPGHYLILKLYFLEGLAFVYTDNDSYYFDFKRTFLNNLQRISQNSRINFFSSLLNICMEKSYAGQSEFNKEEFSLCREMVSRNILKSDNDPYIDPALFRNMALIAIQNKETEWLSKLLAGKIEELHPDIRQHFYDFFNAIIFFEEKKFANSLEIMSKVKDKGEMLKINIYTLKMKLYYELYDFEGMKFTADSFWHFLKNNKYISQRTKVFNSDFLKIYNSIVKILKNLNENYTIGKEGKKHTQNFEINKTRNTVNRKPFFKEKSWVLEKLAELENKLN